MQPRDQLVDVFEWQGSPLGRSDRRVVHDLIIEVNSDESNKNQKVKIHPQTSLRSAAEKAERIDRAYKNLIAVLNKHGLYPKTRAEAKRMAKVLLERGWEEE